MKKLHAYPVAALTAVSLAASASAAPVRAGQAVPSAGNGAAAIAAPLPARASKKAEDGSQLAAGAILLPLVIVAGIAGIVAASSSDSDSNG